MRILSAIYVADDGEQKEIHPRELTSRIYENKFKDWLYCPTENCPARISFSSGKYAHFRTWRFDRVPLSIGRNTTDTISVEISFNRRQNALHDAFIQMNLTEEEKEALRDERAAATRARLKKREITRTKKNATSMQLVLFDGEDYEDESVHRRRNIVKRLRKS